MEQKWIEGVGLVQHSEAHSQIKTMQEFFKRVKDIAVTTEATIGYCTVDCSINTDGGIQFSCYVDTLGRFTGNTPEQTIEVLLQSIGSTKRNDIGITEIAVTDNDNNIECVSSSVSSDVIHDNEAAKLSDTPIDDEIHVDLVGPEVEDNLPW